MLSLGRIAIIGGGIAGLTAAVTCAESGARVLLLEAHSELGGRARSSDGPYKANIGPHVPYKDGPLWRLAERRLLPPHAGMPLASVKLRWQGEIRRTPPLGVLPSVLSLRGREAPVDLDFRTWAAEHTDERTAAMLSAGAGVYTFHHDPGELSAAFVWPRTVRTLLSPPPKARYVIGAWNSLVASLQGRARELGVAIAGPWPLSVRLPLKALRGLSAAIAGERYTLESVGTLGGAICLFCKDDHTLMRWRASILKAVGVPDGVDEQWRIHLTVCRGPRDGTADAVEEAMGKALPLRCEVRGLLLAQMHSDPRVAVQPL